MTRQQAVLQELQVLLQGLTRQRAERWIPWATHASAALLASALTSLMLWLGR